jgi:hypothetical protein
VTILRGVLRVNCGRETAAALMLSVEKRGNSLPDPGLVRMIHVGGVAAQYTPLRDTWQAKQHHRRGMAGA